MNYDFDWFYVKKGLPQLMEGLWLTLELTMWANLIGLVLGFLVALGMLSKIKSLIWPLTAYIEFLDVRQHWCRSSGFSSACQFCSMSGGVRN